MNKYEANLILEKYGNPKIELENVTLIISRQTEKDIQEIETKSDQELIDHWKNLTWLNFIYGQSSLNDLQRIELIELEMDQRPLINFDELNQWLKKQEDKEIEAV